MSKGGKRLAAAAGMIVTAAVLVLLIRRGPIEVETVRARRDSLQETVGAQGQTRVRNRYVVAAPVGGRVTRIELQEGDSILRGQIVARVFPAPLDSRGRLEAAARLRQADDAASAARAGVAKARSALDQARRSAARAAELGQRGLLAAEERERAELNAITLERELESADFHAQAAAHDVEVARAALSGDQTRPIDLRSPIRGRVMRIQERSERVVVAGAPLVELADPGQLEVVADLLSRDAVRVHPGDLVLFEEWGGEPFAGRLRLVEPSGYTKVSALGVEEQRVNTIADLTTVPPALGDRFRVEMRIVVWRGNSVLQVPAGAVFRRGSGWAAYVVVGGRARLRPIQIGHRTPFEVEVVDGLVEGDEVIRNPGDRVADGIRVRARQP